MNIGDTQIVPILKIYGRTNKKDCTIVQQKVFLEIYIKQCKSCNHRTIDMEKTKTTIFGPKNFWSDKLRLSLRNNQLEVDIEGPIPNCSKLYHISSNKVETNKVLTEYQNAITCDELVYYNYNRQSPKKLTFSNVKLFYEEICRVSYASIAIQLPIPSIPIGTLVTYQVFDKIFETRVTTDKTKDGIFYKRILSKDANNQKKDSPHYLLTDNVWINYKTVRMKYHQVDIKYDFST